MLKGRLSEGGGGTLLLGSDKISRQEASVNYFYKTVVRDLKTVKNGSEILRGYFRSIKLVACLVS